MPTLTSQRGSSLSILVALSAAVLVTGCASTGGDHRGKGGYTERGLASWYGPGFHGKHAANGEVYDMHELTAAHRTLPFDSVVQVRNRDNGRRVEVRITDRGPFVKGRIIDLSYEAARRIDMLGPGVAPVEIRVIKNAMPAAGRGDYWVQVGAFRDAEEARVFYRQMQRSFSDVELSSESGWHRVRLGPFAKQSKAESTRKRVERRGIDAFVTQL